MYQAPISWRDPCRSLAYNWGDGYLRNDIIQTSLILVTLVENTASGVYDKGQGEWRPVK